jgi:hypothetical protein
VLKQNKYIWSRIQTYTLQHHVPCCCRYTQVTLKISDQLSLAHLTDLFKFNTKELPSVFQRKAILPYMPGNQCPSIYILKNPASSSSRQNMNCMCAAASSSISNTKAWVVLEEGEVILSPVLSTPKHKIHFRFCPSI